MYVRSRSIWRSCVRSGGTRGGSAEGTLRAIANKITIAHTVVPAGFVILPFLMPVQVERELQIAADVKILAVLLQRGLQPVESSLSIGIVANDGVAFIATGHHAVQSTGEFDSQRSCHAARIPCFRLPVKCLISNVGVTPSFPCKCECQDCGSRHKPHRRLALPHNTDAHVPAPQTSSVPKGIARPTDGTAPDLVPPETIIATTALLFSLLALQ